MKFLLFSLTLIFSLSGCSSPKEETAVSDQPHKQLYNAVNQPLEQAKGVEKQVLDSAEQQKKQMDGLVESQ